jgi:hypothetical protein
MAKRDDDDGFVQELQRSKHIRMGVYADPGTAKTDLVGSSQELGRTLLIRPPVDHTDSILNPGPNLRERVIHDWGEMNDTLDHLRMEGDKYAWVWVDSWSLLQDILLDDIWDTTVNEKPHRGRYGLDKQEYGINFLRMGIWMRHVIGADLFNFGFTAHPAMVASPDLDDDGDPIEKLMPWIQGKQMTQKFCGYCNLVGWIDKGKSGKRIFKATSDEVHYAKDQFDAIPQKGVILPRSHGMKKISDLVYKARPAMRPGSNTNQRRATRRPARATRKGRS